MLLSNIYLNLFIFICIHDLNLFTFICIHDLNLFIFICIHEHPSLILLLKRIQTSVAGLKLVSLWYLK